MVKHDRRVVEPNQSCLVFAKEGEFLLGSSPIGPKGEFGMRFADSPDDKFTIHYNHQMYAPFMLLSSLSSSWMTLMMMIMEWP